MRRPDGPRDGMLALRPTPASGSVVIPVGRHPLLFGRDRGCDVVVLDPHVSRQHALIWCQRGRLMVRDLGSAMGTKAGNRRIQAGEVQAVEVGEPLRLAGKITFVWSEPPIQGDARWLPRTAFRRESKGWASVGASASQYPASVPGQALDADETSVTLHSNVSEWLGSEFEIGRYNLSIALERGAPAEARFEDITGSALMIGGEARVVLLFVLARRRLLYDSGKAESPWLDDHDLGVGLWGTRASELPASRLNTLVTRVRAQLEGATFPRDLVEKRPGQTRLGPAVARVALQGWSKESMKAVPGPETETGPGR